MERHQHIKQFVRVLWKWYTLHKRSLPWRDLQIEDDTQRAYQVLVSEVMLQQTQVSRVIPAYRNFLERFPTLGDLARASNTDAILAWRGMGYNNRALRLRDATRVIVEKHQGIFPAEMEDLLALPGLGHYTAAALRNFAFHIPEPCLDTNIRRILHRVFVGPERSDGTWVKDDTYLLTIAAGVLDVSLQSGGRTTADWHAALMDFGSLVCTKTNPKWERCPLTKAGLCKAAYKVKVQKRQQRVEPGRQIAGKFVPNRIIRGRIVDELRDAPAGLPSNSLGSLVCLDWSPQHHAKWLRGILKNLERDGLVERTRGRYLLKR